MTWAKPQPGQISAVALANFAGDGEAQLKITVGQSLVVDSLSQDWCHGRLEGASDGGIFPRSFVHFRAPKTPAMSPETPKFRSISVGGWSDNAQAAEEASLVHEITTALKLCWAEIKKRYLHSGLGPQAQLMSGLGELVGWEKEISASALPREELKNRRWDVANRIDALNSRLGLDMVVRDALGYPLVTERTAVLEVYRQHLRTAERNEAHKHRIGLMTKSSSENAFHGPVHQSSDSFAIFVSINNLQVHNRFRGECELTLALYEEVREDGKAHYVPFSENLTVNWPLIALASEKNKQTAIFVDLGAEDRRAKRMLLICRLVRVGPMEGKDSTLKGVRKFSHAPASPAHSGNSPQLHVRQPYALAILELGKDFFKDAVDSEPRLHFLPTIMVEENNFEASLRRQIASLHPAAERGTEKTSFLEGVATLKKGDVDLGELAGRLKEVAFGEHLAVVPTAANQGLSISTSLLCGTSEEIRAAHPHLFSSHAPAQHPTLVRKMGFPDVIVEGEVRSELYLTLVSGDLSHATTRASDSNIEVKVCLADDAGKVVPGSVVTMCDGAVGRREDYYHSLVHYHDDKPRWSETIKESGDTAKPFALAWLRLIQDNRTIIADGAHDVLVYRVDRKGWDEADATYKNLPASRRDLETAGYAQFPNKGSIQVHGYTLSSKDSFLVRTLTCSTGLTQNMDLLGLLDWKQQGRNLKKSLEFLMGEDGDDPKAGEEVVKFLHTILDVLFDILTKTSDYDTLVFDALVYVIKLMGETRYKTFRKVMDDYLDNGMNSTLAHQKLIPILTNYIRNVEVNQQKSRKTLQSLEYLMKFIVTSRELYEQLSPNADRREFESNMRKLLEAMVLLMSNKDMGVVTCQGALLKFLPITVPQFAFGVEKPHLAAYVVEMLGKLGQEQLAVSRLACLRDLIRGQLFADPAARGILLPIISSQVTAALEAGLCAGPEDANPANVDMAAAILEAALDRLSGDTKSPADMGRLLNETLRSLIQTVIKRNFQSSYVSILIAMLSRMTGELWRGYLDSLETSYDRLDFLTELLMVIRDMVTALPFQADWAEMKNVMNTTMLGILSLIATSVKEQFTGPDFDKQLWLSFFTTMVAYIRQDHLQLETLSKEKRAERVKRFGDMRQGAGRDLRSMWFSLTVVQKKHFIPGLVGSMLDVVLVEDAELREATMPIFFDMMSSESITSNSRHRAALDPAVRARVKPREREFESELISQLDEKIVNEGRGSRDFAAQFVRILREHCDSNSDVAEEGAALIGTLEKLLRLLLEMRDLRTTGDNALNRMSCTLHLLDFYQSIGQVELYMRYVYKLYDLHKVAHNFIEAGFALKLHADKLEWSDAPLTAEQKKAQMHRKVRTQRELKENILREIISLFDEGEYWEGAIGICKDLQQQYEQETFDYHKLPLMLKKMASMYDEITRRQRCEPSYFRVAFIGTAFPAFLSNKTLIFRGESFEKLGEFNQKMMAAFPAAKLSPTLNDPSPEERQSERQVMQICSVTPIDDKTGRFKARKIDKKVEWFYKHNEVQKFEMSRRVKKDSGRKDQNEFVDLWLERRQMVTSERLPGLLKWFPVTSTQTNEVSPLQVAIETVEGANLDLRDLWDSYRHGREGLSLQPLKQKLIGICEAAVQGGIANYEAGFFNAAFLDAADDAQLARVEQLKDAIADQIPPLEACICIHAEKAEESERQFHEHILAKFLALKASVEAKYGKKESLMGYLPRYEMLPRKRTTASTSSSNTPTRPNDDPSSRFSNGGNKTSSANLDSTSTRSPSGRAIGSGMRNPQGAIAFAMGLGNANKAHRVPRAKSTAALKTHDDDHSKRSSNLSISSSHSNDSGATGGLQPIEISEQYTTQRPRRPTEPKVTIPTAGSLSSLQEDAPPESPVEVELPPPSDTNGNLPTPPVAREPGNGEHMDTEAVSAPPPLPPRSSLPPPSMEALFSAVPPPDAPAKPPFPSALRTHPPTPTKPAKGEQLDQLLHKQRLKIAAAESQPL